MSAYQQGLARGRAEAAETTGRDPRGQTNDAANLGWLLDDFRRACRRDHVLVLSVDGLLIGAPGAEPRRRRAHVGDRRRLPEPGPRRRRQFGGGRSARPSWRWSRPSCSSPLPGRGPAWRCWPTASADIGLIAYEMAMLVKRVGQTYPRRFRAQCADRRGDDGPCGSTDAGRARWCARTRMTRGRARPTAASSTCSRYVGRPSRPGQPCREALQPEHVTILHLLRGAPAIGRRDGVPPRPAVGVVRVLWGICSPRADRRTTRPARRRHLPDEHILQAVIDGLRAL